MIFDMSEQDFGSETGTVYFMEDEEKFTLYKLPNDRNIIFRFVFIKKPPSMDADGNMLFAAENIMFMERNLVSARRIQGVEKDVTFNVSMS